MSKGFLSRFLSFLNHWNIFYFSQHGLSEGKSTKITSLPDLKNSVPGVLDSTLSMLGVLSYLLRPVHGFRLCLSQMVAGKAFSLYGIHKKADVNFIYVETRKLLVFLTQ